MSLLAQSFSSTPSVLLLFDVVMSPSFVASSSLEATLIDLLRKSCSFMMIYSFIVDYIDSARGKFGNVAVFYEGGVR